MQKQLEVKAGAGFLKGSELGFFVSTSVGRILQTSKANMHQNRIFWCIVKEDRQGYVICPLDPKSLAGVSDIKVSRMHNSINMSLTLRLDVLVSVMNLQDFSVIGTVDSYIVDRVEEHFWNLSRQKVYLPLTKKQEYYYSEWLPQLQELAKEF